jgi:hypothetical protein
MHDSMSGDISPDVALDVARAARRAAVDATRLPRWFPTAAGLSYALGFGLLGVSALIHGDRRAAFAIAGLLMCVVNIGSFGILAARGVRAGVLPSSGGTASRRARWMSTGFVPAPIAVAGVVWLVTGRVGLASLALGALLGISTWWRLSAWRRARAQPDR